MPELCTPLCLFCQGLIFLRRMDSFLASTGHGSPQQRTFCSQVLSLLLVSSVVQTSSQYHLLARIGKFPPMEELEEACKQGQGCIHQSCLPCTCSPELPNIACPPHHWRADTLQPLPLGKPLHQGNPHRFQKPAVHHCWACPLVLVHSDSHHLGPTRLDIHRLKSVDISARSQQLPGSFPGLTHRTVFQ